MVLPFKQRKLLTGIPQVAIFTKINQACSEIRQDVKNVFMSEMLQKKVGENQIKRNVGQH